MDAFDTAVDVIGSYSAVAKIVDVSPQAVRCWGVRRRLPRTEYTGETRYAELIAAATVELGCPITADQLLGKVPFTANRSPASSRRASRNRRDVRDRRDERGRRRQI